MKSLTSRNTSAIEGITIGIIDWWFARSQFLRGAALLLERTPDEDFTGLSDESVGRACSKHRDPVVEFKRDVEGDPCARYLYQTYARQDYDLDRWIYGALGSTIKNLPEWEERLSGIKKTYIRLKVVKTVLES